MRDKIVPREQDEQLLCSDGATHAVKTWRQDGWPSCAGHDLLHDLRHDWLHELLPEQWQVPDEAKCRMAPPDVYSIKFI
jgi:hypothetical protein